MIESSLFRFHEISDTRGPGDNSLVPEGAFGQKPFESSFSCPAPAPAVSVPRMYPGKGRGGGGTGGGSMVRVLNSPSFLNCLLLFSKGSNPS